MNLRQAQCLDAVGRSGSFRAAAAMLGLSQPAVSQHVAELERALHLELVTRGPRGATLNEAGVTLMPRVRAFIAAEQAAVAEAAIIRARHGSLVRVSCVNGALIDVLATALARFVAEHPTHQIEVREAGAVEVLDRVIEGRDDFGVLGTLSHADPIDLGVDVEPIGPVPLVLAVPRRHPLARARRIDAGVLAAEPLVAFHRGWAIRDALDSYLEGRSANIVCEVAAADAARSLVAAGVGVALLPRPSPATRTAGIVLRDLDPSPPTPWRMLVGLPGSSRSPAAQSFHDLLMSARAGGAGARPVREAAKSEMS